MPIDPKDELRSLLRELFQLDKTDLDFGIYRIMNLRAKDVEDFIDNNLPATLKTVTDRLADKSKDEASAQVEEAKAKLKQFIEMSGETAETNDEINAFAEKMPNAPVVKKYLEAKEAVSSVSHSADLERDIYNDLYRFFNRYYDEGDFITKPRAGEHTYMIPYNGEEVKFYWANRDQYYIKTGENFRNYIFTNNETDAGAKITVEFRLMDAETATNNNQNKKGRVFIPTEDYFDWNAADRKLTIKFYYKVPNDAEKETWGDKQSVKADSKGINEKLTKSLDEQIEAVQDKKLNDFWKEKRTIKVKNKGEQISNFYYHLNRYTTTNSFDYFIHKDLRGFLMQELDYFLKHEVFSLNFIAPDFSDEQTSKSIKENILRASAIRSVAVAVIEFLAELENFQKMLFEKKKFVVQSDYCITLDLVPADLIDAIVEFVRSDGEQKQLLEWQKLGFIDALDLDAERIKADKYLVLDTQFLSAELKFKLLGGIEDLDEKCGGLLINSDNFQALNFLQDKYAGKIKCVYIDPPYNTGSDGFLYKDGFNHSSWLSLIHNRLELARSLMNPNSIGFVHLNDIEVWRLRGIIDEIFDIDSYLVTITTKSSTVSSFKTVNLGPVDVTEQIIVFAKNKSQVSYKPQYIQKQKVDLEHFSRFVIDKDIPANKWQFKSIKHQVVEELAGQAVSKTSEGMKLLKQLHGKAAEKLVLESSEDFAVKNADRVFETKTFQKPSAWLIEKIEDSKNSDIVQTYKRDNLDTIHLLKGRQLYFLSKNIQLLNGKPTLVEPISNIWTDIDTNNLKHEGDVDFANGKKPLKLVQRIITMTDDAKGEILDFFAGSGTTGHAVINLNRADDGNRKYILVEMGEYFDTVTKPRIQKVVYSADWKSGKPVRDNKPLLNGEGMSSGISHIFQYIKLEQYEDSLNNIEFDEAAEKAQLVFTDQIKYILQKGTRDSASLLAIGKLANPFNYEMEIIRLNERRLTKIDLPTTFNFLLGIDVARYRVLEHQATSYHVIHGKRGQQAFIIIWRHWTDALDMANERDWITAQDWYSEDAEIFTNADNAFKAKSIEAEFKKLMIINT